MGRDTECDQRVASIPVSQYGPHACVAGATTLMTECVVLVDQPVAHLRILLLGVVHTPMQSVTKSAFGLSKRSVHGFLVAFQGAQVANKAGKVLGAHLIRIR